MEASEEDTRTMKENADFRPCLVLPNPRQAQRRGLFCVFVPNTSPNKNFPKKLGNFRRNLRGTENSRAGGSVWFGKQMNDEGKR
ncbi:hypothetical protein EUGRSUZ_B01673 [Eucalyptus grandis]|uniref:Uncharacterized protein n=2 Tax=Eucalyptus grandis TaxID=71139 RepID=A0ACC3LT43_EUCGR|nr:hypothetical protein EUGRSUZ_B01673 [Eucalyptus grandis]